MYSMVLVEDESYERRSLIDMIDWSLIDIAIIGEAANGEQGLTIIEKCQPDIVLTDVNMPVMNGIEMSRVIRASWPEMRIIFLSAYDDFDYARNAIDLSVEAYVMKPVNETELLRTVKRVADGITERKIERRLLAGIQSGYTKSVELARQALIIKLLRGMPVSDEDARRLNIEWFLRRGHEASLLISDFDRMETPRIDEALPTLNQHLQKLCARFLNIVVLPGRLATFFLDGEPARLEDAVRRFFSEIHVQPGTVRLVMGDPDGRSLSERYDQAIFNHEKGARREENKPRRNRAQIVSDVERIIQEQYQQPLSLESIAKLLHFTPNYVSVLFRTEKHVSVNRFLMQVRLEKAREELQTASEPISEIALRCGFGSITYFHTAFKHEYGVTPNEYRSQSTGD